MELPRKVEQEDEEVILPLKEESRKTTRKQTKRKRQKRKEIEVRRKQLLNIEQPHSTHTEQPATQGTVTTCNFYL